MKSDQGRPFYEFHLGDAVPERSFGAEDRRCSRPAKRRPLRPPSPGNAACYRGVAEQNLMRLGITLHPTTSPSANCVPARRQGNQIHISGQVPSEGGKDKFTGKLGSTFDAVSKQEIFAEAIAMFYPAGKGPATIDVLRNMKDDIGPPS
jgi:hypothetical protein